MFNKMEDDNLISRINSALAFVLWTINTMVAIAIAIAIAFVVVVSGRRLQYSMSGYLVCLSKKYCDSWVSR